VNAALVSLAVAVSAAVHFEAPPVVSRFMDSDAFVRVIHGPVGSGKSSGCILEILRRALEQEPNAKGVRDTRWVVVRNTYRELEDTTRKTFEQWLGALGEWREKDFAFDIDRPLADGTHIRCEVLFRALDKPQDVKKLLSLELTGGYINELREVPKVILDGLQMRVGRYPKKSEGGATWYGVWADTNPWAETSEYAELFASKPESFELFRQPSGLAPNAENKENLPDAYYERMSAGKDAAWIAEYVEGKNPRTDKGVIYGEWIAALRERGGVLPFDHPKDGVFAILDLGVSDSTSIWWVRLGKGGALDVIDWYENSGFGASHYFAVLKGEAPEGVPAEFVPKRYELLRIYLPHDAKQRTFQTGVSTLDQFITTFPGRVGLVPELDVASGIDGGRWLLEQPIRVHSRCEAGLKRLGLYRFEWDEVRKVFKKTPLHDWTSHAADGWRYVAAVYKPVWLAAQEALPKKPPLGAKAAMTLDEEIELSESYVTKDRRI
jgi:hypothetical protein